MVSVKLIGGMGNQLFQAAFAYALLGAGNEVILDRSPLDNDSTRAYILDHWNVDIPLGYLRAAETREPNLRHHPEFIKKYHQDTAMVGYWQCSRYWAPAVQETIKKAFTLRETPSAKTLAIAREIENSNSCFLHVRRTDNLNVSGMKNHGLCEFEWYGRAMEYARKVISNPAFFVFSDDIEWCKQQPELLGLRFVDHNSTGVTVDSNHDVWKTDDGTEHEDLWLMSRCKHGITANSSFSWFGAWLQHNPQKITISPKQWFSPTSQHDATDIVPAEWVRL